MFINLELDAEYCDFECGRLPFCILDAFRFQFANVICSLQHFECKCCYCYSTVCLRYLFSFSFLI